MKTTLKSFLLFIVFFISINLSFSQKNDDGEFTIDYITTKQGLSHNYVTSIVSDDLNIKWIGTENGITKFNGYNYSYIKPNGDFKDLINENIEVLFLDKQSNLWIGTKSGGLSAYNLKNNRLKNYNYLFDFDNQVDIRITSLAQDTEGYIWVGTWKNGLHVISPKDEKLIRSYNYYQPIYTIKKDFNDNIWFCSGARLFQFDKQQKTINQFNLNEPISDVLSDESRNKIWIATTGKDENLYAYTYNTNEISSINMGVKSNFAKRLSIDNDDRIWVGTWRNGVYRSNKDLTVFEEVNIVREESGKIKGNYSTVLHIHHDKNNITWLTTAGGGIAKLIEGNGFSNGSSQLINNGLKGYFNTTAIHKTNDNIYIGTLLKGLYHGTTLRDIKPIKGLEDIKINALYEFENKLYVGSARGFSILDINSNKIIYSNSTLKKTTNFLVSADTLFIGTQQLGVVKMHLKDVQNPEKHIRYSEDQLGNRKIESNRITTIRKDNNQLIWIGTYNGLHRYDVSSAQFIHQSKLLDKPIPGLIINSILVNGSDLWAATPNGLFKFNVTSDALVLEKTINKFDGLNSDFICSVTQDNQSNIWFSTHTEIVKFNELQNTIKSYGELNGIKSTSFNNNSFFNHKGSVIYFGGIDDVTFFNPNQIKEFSSVPEIVFTNLRVNNNLIGYKEGTEILDKNFNYANQIQLTHKENFFSTSFVINDFLGNLNVHYRYKLEGSQEDWVYLQNRNEINFAGLNPGNYNLMVEVSRDKINWSNPKIMQISISGSPWKSPLAILIYTILVLGITVFLIKQNNDRIRLQNNLKIAEIDKQKDAELTEAKLNFFTNISHEFRTPLTLIVSPLKDLIERKDIEPEVLSRLSYIERNSNRLLNLINQLLDFRKADHGLLTLEVSEGNFVRFANEVFLYFKEAAEAKKVTYTFKSKKEEISLPFDRNKMEIVLCNILSNALKYTSEGDEITMTINSDDENCIVTIADSGIGMKEKDAKRIFDRFYQIKSTTSAKLVGSGIGLSFSKKIVELHHGSIAVQSKPKQGSVFSINLSLDLSLYKDSINSDFLKTDNIKAYKKISPSEVKSLKIERKENTLLIVDDNPEILGYLEEVFNTDFKILNASNGKEALEVATKEIPDIVISDVMMPVMDGIAFSKELKSQITTSHIPIILLTARTSTVYEIEGLKTGANDYVTKPFDANVIKARVKALLDNRDKLQSYLLNKIRFEPTSEKVESDLDKENEFISKAIKLVEDNLENSDFDIDTMVKELFMSRSSLFRKIKSLTGLSLSAFIRSIRLKRAAHLILTSDMNMSQISYQVGFKDYKYFKNSFKKQFNCLPSKYAETSQERT